MAKGKSNTSQVISSATETTGEQDAPESPARLIYQGWISIAFCMTVGLLLEGLLGYKIPAYLIDPERRELFRLAHTHGTFLGLVIIAAALCEKRGAGRPSRAARTALRLGAVLMPLGFLLA